MQQLARGTYLQLDIIIRPEEERDRIPLYPGPVNGPMDCGLEHVVYQRQCAGCRHRGYGGGGGVWWEKRDQM